MKTRGVLPSTLSLKYDAQVAKDLTKPLSQSSLTGNTKINSLKHANIIILI